MTVRDETDPAIRKGRCDRGLDATEMIAGVSGKCIK
jgi:hypothetical protein